MAVEDDDVDLYGDLPEPPKLAPPTAPKVVAKAVLNPALASHNAAAELVQQDDDDDGLYGQLGGTGGMVDEETAAIAAASRAAAFAGVEDGTAAPSVPAADADGAVHADGAAAADDDDDDDGGFQIVLDSPDRGGGAASDLDGDDDFHIVLDAQTGSGNPYIPTTSGPPRYNAPAGAPPAPGGGARANQYVREGAAPLAPRPALPKPDWGTDAAALTALLESKPLPLGPAAGKGMPHDDGGGGGGAIPPPRPPTGPPPGPMSQRPSGMHLVTAPVGPGGHHHPAGIPRNAGEGGGDLAGGHQYGSILPGRSTPPRHVGPNDDGSWATYDGKAPLARWNEEGQRILPGMGGGTRFIPPEEYKEFLALGHGGIFDVDLDHIDCAPWRQPGSEPSDYFNYGMNETSWRAYAQQVRHVRMEAAHRSRIATFDSAQLQQQQQQQQQAPPVPQMQQQQATPYAAYQGAQQQQRGPPMGRPPPGMQAPPAQRGGRQSSASPSRDDVDGEDAGRGGRGGNAWDNGPPGGGYRDGGRGGGGGGYDPRSGYPPPWAFGPPPGGGMGAPPWAMAPGPQSRPPPASRGREGGDRRDRRERDAPRAASPAAPASTGPRIEWLPPPGVKRERSRSRDRDGRSRDDRNEGNADGKRRRR